MLFVVANSVYAKRKRQKFSTSTLIVEPQQQQPRSRLTCNCGSEYVKNNAPTNAGTTNISKENNRMALLQRLQIEAEKSSYITINNLCILRENFTSIIAIKYLMNISKYLIS